MVSTAMKLPSGKCGVIYRCHLCNMNSNRGYECVFGIVLVHAFSVCSLASVLLYGMICDKGAYLTHFTTSYGSLLEI